MADTFLTYKAKHIRKINALRRAASSVDIKSVPVLTPGEVLFSPASDTGGDPRSCYNCPQFNQRDKTCYLHGPDITVCTFIYPPAATADSKQIEYWPVCGYWRPGPPNKDKASYASHLIAPQNSGLVWINAPKIGQEYGGTSCGGQEGGDDCDHYITDQADKRACPTGFCRVMQRTVTNGDCCTAWRDDDEIPYEQAAACIKELDGDK